MDRLVAADLRGDQGWKFFADLHNHPFSFDNPSGDIAGTVISSSGDRNHYLETKALGLQRAWIINGIDSMDIPAAKFSNIPEVE